MPPPIRPGPGPFFGGPTTPTRPGPTGPTLPGRPPIRPPVGPPRYVEPRFEVEINNSQWRPPTTNDFVVKKGFDLRTPEESVALVKQMLQNPLLPANAKLVEEHAGLAYKGVTVSINNFFSKGSPHEQLMEKLGANEGVVLGSLRWDNHAILKVVPRGETEPRYFQKKSPGGFEEVPAPAFVVYEGYFRKDPAGVELRTVPWSAPALAGVLTTIEEL